MNKMKRYKFNFKTGLIQVGVRSARVIDHIAQTDDEALQQACITEGGVEVIPTKAPIKKKKSRGN